VAKIDKRMTIEELLPSRAQPDRRPTVLELSIPNSPDKVALIVPELGARDRPFRNLVRRDPQQLIVWIAELPDPDAVARFDCYVHVEWDGPHLGATSWSGYYVHIDPSNGVPFPLQPVRFTK
jgi:hypothetical protein